MNERGREKEREMGKVTEKGENNNGRDSKREGESKKGRGI
jgi:hypothetical protein